MPKTYTYKKADGSTGTVQANDPAEAMRVAPGIARNSGVQEERSLPSMDETKENAGSLPIESGLPDAPKNKLQTFSQAVRNAAQLAREARNRRALATTGKAYPTGILPNFGSILGNLNNASDSFSDDVISELDAAMKADEKKFELRTVGKNLIQFELGPSGEVVGQKVVASAPETGGGDVVDFFGDAQQRDLAQGRLNGADPTVQTIFVRAPQEFRDSWIRNNVGQDNSTVNASALLADLENWEAMQDQKKSGAITNPFVTPGQ